MAKPIAPWNADQDFSHAELVWWATLDDRYQVEVHRTGPRTGILYVFDHRDGDKELASWPVGLSFGAVLGPDIDDVVDWQNKIVDFIDNGKK